MHTKAFSLRWDVTHRKPTDAGSCAVSSSPQMGQLIFQFSRSPHLVSPMTYLQSVHNTPSKLNTGEGRGRQVGLVMTLQSNEEEKAHRREGATQFVEVTTVKRGGEHTRSGRTWAAARTSRLESHTGGSWPAVVDTHRRRRERHSTRG